MEFRLQGFDMERHYSQVFPRASSSSSSNFVYSSGHVTNGGGGTLGGCQVMDIHREIEKERIREEIIAAEIERRRVLEAEVRRELMIESEMMALQSGGRFPSSFKLETPLRTHYHDLRFEPEILHGDWFTPDDRRIATPFPEKYGDGGSHSCEIGGFEAVPFRQRPPSPKIKKITSNRPKDGKAIIGLGKPSSATFSGSKREAGLSPSSSAVRGSNGGSSSTSKKKKKEEWNCMVCGISVTSERHLNEHLSGKKHQAQMEAPKPYNNNGADVGSEKIKKQPSNTQNSVPVDLKEDKKKIKEEWKCMVCGISVTSEHHLNEHLSGKKHQAQMEALKADDSNGGDIGSEKIKKQPSNTEPIDLKEDKKKIKEEWKCMVCGISVTSERHLNEHLSEKKHQDQMEAPKPYNNNKNNGADTRLGEIKEQPSNTEDSVPTDLKEDKKIAGEGTRKKFRFWCSMCQVGAPDDKIMSKHKKGKKHLKNLLKKARGSYW